MLTVLFMIFVITFWVNGWNSFLLQECKSVRTQKPKAVNSRSWSVSTWKSNWVKSVRHKISIKFEGGIPSALRSPLLTEIPFVTHTRCIEIAHVLRVAEWKSYFECTLGRCSTCIGFHSVFAFSFHFIARKETLWLKN